MPVHLMPIFFNTQPHPVSVCVCLPVCLLLFLCSPALGPSLPYSPFTPILLPWEPGALPL